MGFWEGTAFSRATQEQQKECRLNPSAYGFTESEFQFG
jgi:hypothetical protein